MMGSVSPFLGPEILLAQIFSLISLVWPADAKIL